MSIVTLFQNPKKILASKPLLTVLSQIQRGTMKPEVLNLRQFFNNDLGHRFDLQKRQLPFFSVSGHFTDRNNKIVMANYSGYQILELTYLSELDKKKVRRSLERDPYCFCCFETAIGLGLNIIVKTNAVKEQHRAWFGIVKTYYERFLGIRRFSIHSADLNFLCLFSYDEKAYINLNAKVF